jgi:acetate kinase
MGLTPLEGLIGGTRAGTIDPTAIFHHTTDCSADAGLDGMKVTKAEMVLNKLATSQATEFRLLTDMARKSGLSALAGTTNFGLIISRLEPPSSTSDYTKEEHEASLLAYKTYLDRLNSYISQYLFKLFSSDQDKVDGIVFSGGIGEKAEKLRADVMRGMKWLGIEVGDGNKGGEGTVTQISKEAGSGKLGAWVVETDEEGWCARLAREDFGV